MEYVSNWKLHKNGILTAGQKYFVFRWLELYNQYTIDSFRYRAMNSHSIINELLNVIVSVEKGIWNEVNIKLVKEEALDVIIKDLVLKNNIYVDEVKKALENIVEKQKPTHDDRERLKVSLLGIHTDLQRRYWEELITGLKESIGKDDLDTIEWYISALATYLVNAGHDRAYLYDSCINILNDRQDKDFSYFYESLVARVQPQLKQYNTYLKLKGEHDYLKGYMLGHEFRSNIMVDITSTPVKNFISEIPVVFAINQIKAMDGESAASIAQFRLSSLLDVIHYANPKARINAETDCLVRHNEDYQVYSIVTPLLGYQPDQNWLNKVNQQLIGIMSSRILDDESKDKLLGALRYFRLSYECGNSEQQFLNLWIALEYMVRSGGKQKIIIESIANSVPKSLALNHINRMVRDTIENIHRSQIRISKQFHSCLEDRNIPDFITLFKNDSAYQELMRSANDHPLLYYRLDKLHNILLSPEGIKSAVEGNQRDIYWHLARMYRFRNRIVHYAARDLNILGVTANLHTYVRTILNIVLYEISTYGCFQDLQEVFIKYQLGYDRYMEALENKDDKAVKPTIIANPLLLMWP